MAETHNHPQPIEGCWRCDATWLKSRLHSDGSCRQCNTTRALLAERDALAAKYEREIKALTEYADAETMRANAAEAALRRVEAMVDAEPVCDWHRPDEAPECHECIGAAAVASYDDALRAELRGES